MNNGKKLTRSKKNKVVAGVCGGLAEYLNVDPTIIRLAAALFCVMGGSGILLYVIAAIIMPEDSGDDYYYES